MNLYKVQVTVEAVIAHNTGVDAIAEVCEKFRQLANEDPTAVSLSIPEVHAELIREPKDPRD